jgi:hypothetical protein
MTRLMDHWRTIKPFALLVFAFFALAGCATPVQPLSAFDDAKLRDASPEQLAMDYFALRIYSKRDHGQDTARIASMQHQPMLVATPESLAQMEEILVEKGLPRRELSAVRKGEVFIGMSRIGLYASKGPPDRENHASTKRGESIQHVYGGAGPYVYTANGFVTSWQN